MSKKLAGRRRPRRDDDDGDVYEDLDLDVRARRPRQAVDEDAIVSNTRKTRAIDDLDVQPQDAYVEEGKRVTDAEDELGLAIATSRRARAGLIDEDFGGPISTSVSSKKAASKRPKKDEDRDGGNDEEDKGDHIAVGTRVLMEQVERDFHALSAAERRDIIAKESPEVIALLADFGKNVAEVRSLADTLHERPWLKQPKAPSPSSSDASGTAASARAGLVAFLHTKLHLLVSYCAMVAFYLLMKAEGQKVKGHPVVDRLVELRVYLEKLWTVEQRLQYALSKLLSTDDSAASQVESVGVRLSALRPVSLGAGGADGTYRPVKVRDVIDEGKTRREQARGLRLAAAVEKEEQGSFNRVRGKVATQAQAAWQERERLQALQGAARPNEEAPDAFFTKLAAAADDDDDDHPAAVGESLVSKLRNRLQALTAAAPHSTAVVAKPKKQRTLAAEERTAAAGGGGSADDEGAEADSDFIDGEDDYEAMVAAQREREQDKRALRRELEQKQLALEEGELDPTASSRRHITKEVQTHRGLTRGRPKDRKNPRTAQRRKYDIGERKAKVTSKPTKPMDAKDFEGVSSLKPHLVYSTRHQA